MSIISGIEWILYPVMSATLGYSLAKATTDPLIRQWRWLGTDTTFAAL